MSEKHRMTGLMGLLLASFFWGAEFVVEKDVLSAVEPNYSNAIRFAAASLICTFYFFPRLKNIRRMDFRNGCITGLFMGLGFAFQTMGLKTIHAGENAILCTSYILLLPFIEWAYFRRNPGLKVFIYAAAAMIGIFLISFEDSTFAWGFSKGEILTLCGSISYAAAIISIDTLSEKTDPGILTLLQFYVITVLSMVFGVAFEQFPAHFSVRLAGEFSYLILFATIGAQLLMNYCMKFVTSSAAGIIFSTESIFAAVLGSVFRNESASCFLWVGMAMIIGANALYQMGFPKTGPVERKEQ